MLLVLAALLSGCSMVRIVYKQAPELVYWWFDRYLDFDDTQSARARESIQRWFAWHRATQLGLYADTLERMRRDVSGPLTAAQACRWFDDLRAHVDTGLRQALPALAEEAVTLTPAQLQHLERRYQRTNDDLRGDYLQPDLAERSRANLDRSIERVEMLYGPLSTAQREAFARSLTASPFDPQRWLDERVARQQEALATLRRLSAERTTAQQAQAPLWTLIEHSQRSPRPEYRGYQQRLIDFNCTLVAQVHNQTTPAQRQAAAERLKGWEDDARALMEP